MPNMSYLLTCDDETIYPSRSMDLADIEARLVAHDVSCIPLLWLAMFRPTNLVSGVFVVAAEHGGGASVVHATAPIAGKDQALAQLRAALPGLHRLFSGNGPLDGHAAMLAEAVTGAGGRFVTVELEEVAVLHGPTERYHRRLADALASLEVPTDPEVDRARLVELSGLRPDRQFPPASLLFADSGADDVADDDLWNHNRLLGASYLRPVPWEPPLLDVP